MLDKLLYGFVLFVIISGVCLLAEIINRTNKNKKTSLIGYVIVFVFAVVLILIAYVFFN
jgi:ABC-type Mn2+/Zn2+ transport system permease subunit